MANPVVISKAINQGLAPAVNAAETVVAVSNQVQTDTPDALVNISSLVNFLTGATVTAVVARIRRGNGVAGVVVGGPVTLAVGAAVQDQIQVEGQDAPGEVDGQVYSLTLQQTGGTSNGTTNSASLETIQL